MSEYGVVIRKDGKVLGVYHDSAGYPTVNLANGAGTRHKHRINVLVANAFLGETDGTIKHRDGDRDNCERFNLYRRTDNE